MKYLRLKRSIAVACAIALGSVALFSCGDNTEKISNEEVAELQKQLDSTMQQYQQLKLANSDYDRLLSSRDSAINAQAKEIQRLINQLNKKNSTQPQPSSNVDNKQIERQQKEIKEKENTIRKLQKQIDQQEQQIKTLQSSASTNSSNKDNSAQYKSQIAKLEKEVASQQKQIEQLNNETKKLRESSANATANASNCEQVKAGYESQIAEMNREIANYKSQVSKLNSDINTLQGQVSSLQSQVATLQQGDKAAAQAAKELASKNEELQSCKNDKSALEGKIHDLQQQVASLSNAENSEIANLHSQIENQRRQIADLQADLQKKNSELEAAKKSNNKATTKGAVNEKLAELQALCDGYVEEIARLRSENEKLRDENSELKNKVSSNSELIAENERLQQKVKLASVLVTSDLRVIPGKSIKPGNLVKSTNKAAQTKVVRIDCRLLDNNVIDPGSVTIYARLANAANRVVCNDDNAGQSFDMNGVPMQYTLKQDIEFTGYGRTLTMIWKKAENVELAPGLYWVSLYANGYEIGKTSFKLN